jgi:hypothetical protein
MYDPPTTAELVNAVRSFLEEQAMPQLEGRTAFHARVAANALAIVARQLELGPAAEATEHDRLTALLGEEGNLDSLNRALCRRIRSGDLHLDSPGLVEHLRTTTLDKLAVDQPKYSGYRRALAKSDTGLAPKPEAKVEK